MNDKDNWDRLIKINVEKSNFIVTGNKNEFKVLPEQGAIAENQIISLCRDESIYVLSSLPLFVFHQKASEFAFETDC